MLIIQAMTAENRPGDPFFDANHILLLALDDFHEAQETGDIEKFRTSGEISRSAYHLFSEANLASKELSARVSLLSFLDAREFSQAKEFGNEVLDQIGDKMHALGVRQIAEYVEYAEAYEARNSRKIETRLEQPQIESIDNPIISPESLIEEALCFAAEAVDTGDKTKYDIAGDRCESAYLMYPDGEVENKVFAAQSAIGFYMKSRSLSKAIAIGEELLVRLGDHLPPESRAQMKDFTRLTRIQMGQEVE